MRENYDLIFKLVELGVLKTPLKISTVKLAKELGMSQQNASRKLIQLEKSGIIRREITVRGEIISLTQEGRKFIESIYLLLKKNLEEAMGMIVKGIVFTGIGEGGYYVTRKYYETQFLEKLGFKPFPGTLNLRLVEPKSRYILETYPHIFIPGTKTKYSTYGWVKCFPAKINGKLRGSIITLERTHYDEGVIEVISPHNLR